MYRRRFYRSRGYRPASRSRYGMRRRTYRSYRPMRRRSFRRYYVGGRVF